MPLLRIKIPGKRDELHTIADPRVTIGRRADNTIQILDPSVSAHHAELVAVNGHYRLRDLDSTNRCLVEGSAVTDFHLRHACTISFGFVECEFDPVHPTAEPGPAMNPAQMEQDLTFLRTENAELREKIRALERRIDILGSAELFGKKGAADHTSGAALQAELDRTREELAIALRARDAARQASGLLQAEKTTILREIRASGLRPSPCAQP